MAYLIRWSPFAPIAAWVQLFLIGTLLLFPISSTAKSVCLALSVGTILFTPDFLRDLKTLLATSWCKAALLLFGIAVIFCWWSPATFAQKAVGIEKYSKLLYLPILVVGFQNATTRRLSLHAFLVAMIITCALSIFKFHGYLQFLTLNPDNVFRNHIMTGFMVAFAAYISFLFSYRNQKRARLTYGLLGLIFTYQTLFVSGSRTGYVIYLLIMMILVLQLCTWRQAIAGILIIGTLFSVSYFTSSVMKTRVNGIAQQIKEYKNNQKDTDLGLRLQFHNYAHKLFNKHPILGNGTASFTYYFNKEKPIAFWTWNLLEPHSQYWLVASEFGILGLGALLYFFFCCIQASRKLNEMKFLAFAMIIPFMIGNLSDSLLFYSGSGYFFIFFMALFLGEELEIKNEKKCASIDVPLCKPDVDLKTEQLISRSSNQLPDVVVH
ncbi:O-antigen ligase family protein [Legionella fallonii]|uniref:Lipid A core-O-antigen ligase-related enzyme n=1 Tax=Legionella fallonii LLAP-10 TaxID=1212491 RepID=A0A098G5F1_9GAMM|nr:O-antigen ligase family protein [Legionella fallonii]CEG57209.1 Lipid A core-O-antigen ligase-related enzyme [Legionella fallonii LLAP-10]